MTKLKLIAKHEFLERIREKGFVLTLIGVPLVLVATIGLAALMSSLESNDLPIGYVDRAGFLAEPLMPPSPASSPRNPTSRALVPMVAFESEQAAQAALEEKEIQSFYVIPSDYGQTNKVRLVFIDAPGQNAGRQFWDLMQINHLRDLDPEKAKRAVAGSELIIRWPNDSPTGGREFSRETFLSQFVPLIVGFSFVLLVFISASALMQAVVVEKENRTMEVMVTSVSASELITGKIVGIIILTLVQVLAWVMFVALAVFIGGRVLGLELFANLRIEWGPIWQVIMVGVPTYVMIAGLLTAIGATMAEVQEAQQVAGLLSLPLMAPMWFAIAFIENPGGPIAVGLSLFPPTSLTTLALRSVFAKVPSWQFIVSASLNTALAVVMIWLAGRAFRLGMLRYGQRMRLGEILGWPAAQEGEQA